MLDISKTEVLKLLEDNGFNVVDMDTPVLKLGDKDQYAIPRRCYDIGVMHRELEWLKENNVKTIGVYTVKKISEVWKQPLEDDGVYIRWAYYAGM